MIIILAHVDAKGGEKGKRDGGGHTLSSSSSGGVGGVLMVNDSSSPSSLSTVQNPRSVMPISSSLSLSPNLSPPSLVFVEANGFNLDRETLFEEKDTMRVKMSHLKLAMKVCLFPFSFFFLLHISILFNSSNPSNPSDPSKPLSSVFSHIILFVGY